MHFIIRPELILDRVWRTEVFYPNVTPKPTWSPTMASFGLILPEKIIIGNRFQTKLKYCCLSFRAATMYECVSLCMCARVWCVHKCIYVIVTAYTVQIKHVVSFFLFIKSLFYSVLYINATTEYGNQDIKLKLWCSTYIVSNSIVLTQISFYQMMS